MPSTALRSFLGQISTWLSGKRTTSTAPRFIDTNTAPTALTTSYSNTEPDLFPPTCVIEFPPRERRNPTPSTPEAAPKAHRKLAYVPEQTQTKSGSRTALPNPAYGATAGQSPAANPCRSPYGATSLRKSLGAHLAPNPTNSPTSELESIRRSSLPAAPVAYRTVLVKPASGHPAPLTAGTCSAFTMSTRSTAASPAPR